MTAQSTKSATTDIPSIAHKFADQLVTSVKEGQQLTVDATAKLTKAVSALPLPELPTLAGVPASPDLKALSTFSFDLAATLLQAQREFTLSMLTTMGAKSL